MIDAEDGERLRRAVREAPTELPVLHVLRQAFSAELMDAQQRHEI